MDNGKRRAALLTTDIGADMDDQWALAHLALAPEIDLRGVVTTHAPNQRAPAAETAAGHARAVFDHLPKTTRKTRRPPVYVGSSVPLRSRDEPLPNGGVRFLLACSRPFTPVRRLAVLVAGAATDVASALLIDPTLAERIEIVAMGFEGWPDGGDPWNVKNDPRAWQVLLASSAPVIVGDAQVTLRRLRLTRDEARDLLADRGAAGRYLAALHTAWLDREPKLCAQVTGSRDAWAVWDQVIVAHLLGLTKAATHPRPTLGDDLRFAGPAQGGGTITWVTDIDADRLWKHLTECLDRARTEPTSAA